MTKSERKDIVVGAILDVEREALAAIVKHAPFSSCHEGWAVIYEELDELWDEVRRKPSARSKAAMRIAAKQVAAMAIRFMVELCDEEQDDNG